MRNIVLANVMKIPSTHMLSISNLCACYISRDNSDYDARCVTNHQHL